MVPRCQDAQMAHVLALNKAHVLALNKAHVLAPRKAHVLGPNKAPVLPPNQAHVLAPNKAHVWLLSRLRQWQTSQNHCFGHEMGPRGSVRLHIKAGQSRTTPRKLFRRLPGPRDPTENAKIQQKSGN